MPKRNDGGWVGQQPNLGVVASPGIWHLEQNYNRKKANTWPPSSTPVWSHTFTSITTSTTTDRSGFRFDVGASAISVNFLRVYLVNTTTAERVIIHRVSDGLEIVRADIGPAAIANDWVGASVSTVTLAANTRYSVSQRAIDGSSRLIGLNASGFVFRSGITFSQGYFGTGDVLPPNPATTSNRMSCGFG